jgi:hypothetical protein
MAWASEGWLRPAANTDLHHERFGNAMGKCRHAGAYCASDGFCHFDGECFKTAPPDIEDRIEKLEAEIAKLKELRT